MQIPVRIRLSGGQVVEAGFRISPAQPEAVSPACDRPATDALDMVARAASAVAVLVEAVPAGAGDIAVTCAEAALRSGLRCGAISLEPQNRLAALMGNPTRSPVRYWQQNAAELLVERDRQITVAAPDSEQDLEPAHLEAVLQRVRHACEIVVVDLGCRWEPRLFRTILAQATHIWLLTRAGQWGGAEMRLQQAELSGWTDMRRVQLVVVGDQLPPPSHLPVAAVVPDLRGRSAHQFVARELGRHVT